MSRFNFIFSVIIFQTVLIPNSMTEDAEATNVKYVSSIELELSFMNPRNTCCPSSLPSTRLCQKPFAYTIRFVGGHLLP